MPLDFAGFGALSGVEPWEEIRQSKMRDAQRIAMLDAFAQQDAQKQQLAAQEIQQTLDTVGRVKVLAQDKQRIAEKEKQLSASIQEGIKRADGNLEKYLNTGGKTELNKYRAGLLESEEVNRGLRNAYIDNLATVSRQK